MDQTRPSRRTALYPPAEPTATGLLELDGLHHMYWEVSGNDDGIPVVFLHGGPGAGCHPHHRRYFDPRHYRVVLFDQRGAGRSEPVGGLIDNTTQHLVDDLERLRKHLEIDRWVLFGGSWGSALALAYGEAHPETCLGLILRGIFLATRGEVDWFLNGMGTVFPEARRRFAEYLPEEERNDLLGAYHRRLTDPDPEIHMPAARAWAAYEGACSTLRHDVKPTAENGTGGRGAFTLARIEAHYFTNDMFLEDGALIANIGKLQGVPTVIVQGRYDMVCPIGNADALVHAWPGVPGDNDLEYKIIPDAGHAASEPGTRAALMAATEKFKSLRG
jgi:proline iminopeptidase